MKLKSIISTQKELIEKASSEASLLENATNLLKELQTISSASENDSKKLIQIIEKNAEVEETEDIHALFQFSNFYANEKQKKLFLMARKLSNTEFLTNQHFIEIANILVIDSNNDDFKKEVFKKSALFCHQDRTKNIPPFVANYLDELFKKVSNSKDQDSDQEEEIFQSQEQRPTKAQPKEFVFPSSHTILLEIKKDLADQWRESLNSKIKIFDTTSRKIDWLDLTEEEKQLFFNPNKNKKTNNIIKPCYEENKKNLYQLFEGLNLDLTSYSSIDDDAYNTVRSYQHDDNAAFLMCWAAAAGRIEIIQSLLESKQVDINTWSKNKPGGYTRLINRHTPLHWALMKGQYQAIAFLLLRGSKTDLLDGYGNNILFFASDALTFKLLIRHLIARESDYTKFLENLISIKNPSGESFVSALMRDSTGGHFDLKPDERWSILNLIAPFITSSMVFMGGENCPIFNALGSYNACSKLYLLIQALNRSDDNIDNSNSDVEMALTSLPNEMPKKNIVLPKKSGLTPLATALNLNLDAAKLLILYNVESPNTIDPETRLNSIEAALDKVCSLICFEKAKTNTIIQFLHEILFQFDESFQIAYWSQLIFNLSFCNYSFIYDEPYSNIIECVSQVCSKDSQVITKLRDITHPILETARKVSNFLDILNPKDTLHGSLLFNKNKGDQVKKSITNFLSSWVKIFRVMSSTQSMYLNHHQNNQMVVANELTTSPEIIAQLFCNSFLLHLQSLKKQIKNPIIEKIISEIKTLSLTPNQAAMFFIRLASSSLFSHISSAISQPPQSYSKTDQLIKSLKEHSELCRNENQNKSSFVNFFENLTGYTSEAKVQVINKLIIYFSTTKTAGIPEETLINLTNDKQFPLNIGFTAEEKKLINDGRLAKIIENFKNSSNTYTLSSLT